MADTTDEENLNTPTDNQAETLQTKLPQMPRIFPTTASADL